MSRSRVVASDPSVADYRATSPSECYGVDTSHRRPSPRASYARGEGGDPRLRGEGEVSGFFSFITHDIFETPTTSPSHCSAMGPTLSPHCVAEREHEQDVSTP